MYYPTLRQPNQGRQTLRQWRGLDCRPDGGEGCFWSMENLSSRRTPALAPRLPRGLAATLTQPQGLLAKEALAWVDGATLYWNGLAVTGPVLSTLPEMCPKQLVGMGAYLVVFPDGIYVNTADLSDWGYLDNQRQVACTESAGVLYSLCMEDGTAYTGYTLSATAPLSPQDGDLWLDTGQSTHTLNRYSATTAAWVQIPTVYVRLSGAGIGQGFRQYDGVTLSGCTGQGAGLNGSAILQHCTDHEIVVTGVLDQSFTQTDGTVTVARTAPKLDYVTECGNRLWGCRYGLAEGQAVNEIYACALGDFTNWNKFQGLATDSYAAQRGSDGPWTGAATHLGCPLFFKENCVEKVYPSAAGAHQIVVTGCRGVQAGCAGSLALVNEVLYYKSAAGICAYDGSLPVCVSQALGQLGDGKAVAGSLEDRYYVAVEGKGLYVLDTARGLWHREDCGQAMAFARVGSALYLLLETGQLLALTGSVGQSQGPVAWQAQTGPLDFDRTAYKSISRLALGLWLAKGSSLEVYLEYDSDGVWRHAGHLSGTGRRGVERLSILPRRCSHLRLRLAGVGDCAVYSLTKVLEEGSDVP